MSSPLTVGARTMIGRCIDEGAPFGVALAQQPTCYTVDDDATGDDLYSHHGQRSISQVTPPRFELVMHTSPNAGLANRFVRDVLGLPTLTFNVFSMTGLVLVTVLHTFPFVYLLAASGLESVDASLEETARVTGAGWLRTFRSVTLPLARPGLFAGWILVFVPALQELSASILLFSSSSITLAVAVYNLYETGYREPVAALAIVTMLIIVGAIGLATRLSRTGAGLPRLESGPAAT